MIYPPRETHVITETGFEGCRIVRNNILRDSIRRKILPNETFIVPPGYSRGPTRWHLRISLTGEGDRWLGNRHINTVFGYNKEYNMYY
jgi:hypothetical protein